MNRVFADQLVPALQKQLAHLYCLVGQDPLLVNESLDLIKQTAFSQGFDESFSVQTDTSTDWNPLFERMQSMGLFFSKQVIHLSLPENLNSSQQKNLTELIGLLNPDILLILQMDKLTKAQEKQDWFKQAEIHQGQIILCQTPNNEQLPRWVRQRAQNMQLKIDADAVQLLCYSYENNLLALKQILQLLTLLYPDGHLSFPRVKDVVEQSSVFTPFQWIDALLEGKEGRANRILQGLQAEDIQPVILLRTLQRELMILLQLSQPQQRMPLDSYLINPQLREQFDRLKIWQNRRPLYTQALQRLTYRKLYQLWQQLAEIERAVKQDFSAQVWDSLQKLSLLFSSH